jgi:cytoskeletal protein CcmA (bactofilin family)
MFSKPVTSQSDAPAANLKETMQRRSVLHDDILIKGDWHSDGIVEFGGSITGDLTVDVLIVTGTGKVEGNVRARSVTVEGHLTGTIAAIDVALSSTAVVTGEIEAVKIRVDSGAHIEGRITTKDKAAS